MALVAGATTTIFACADDKSFVDIGYGLAGGDAAAPSFAPAQQGDASNDATQVDGAAPSSLSQCVSTECPAPFATCPGFGGELPQYACTTDLSSDIWNCGACNHQCSGQTPEYHIQMACTSGQCEAFCQQDWNDCNGITDDGCESNPKSDPNNCGICGIACAAGVDCIDGKCGCPPGQTICNGACVDLKTDDENCGTCGTSCMDNQPDSGAPVPPHMYFGCQAGQCTDLRCVHTEENFWVDCNHDTTLDGCEIDLAVPSADNCGKCGNKCDPGQQCFVADKTGMACQCPSGQTICPAIPPYFPEYCADAENDVRNCGSCGYGCPSAIGTRPTCSHGVCGLECQEGLADCNGRADDGCETDLKKDPANCGACGARCAVAEGQPCVFGRCVTKDCDTGVPQ